MKEEILDEAKIQAGDIVQLKSGGPQMTVKAVDTFGHDNYESADCDWFVPDSKGAWKKENAVFALSSLKKTT